MRQSGEDVLAKDLIANFSGRDRSHDRCERLFVAHKLFLRKRQRAVGGRAGHDDRNLHQFCYNQFPNFKLFSLVAVTMQPRALFYLLVEV